MKGLKGAVPLLPIIGLVVLALAFGSGMFATFGLEEAVFCQDYEFVCAGKATTSQVSNAILNYGSQAICQSDTCTISNVRDNTLRTTAYFTAPADASCWTNFLGAVDCSPKNSQAAGTTSILKLNEHFFASTWIQYDQLRQDAVLKWCGQAACDAGVTGVQVLGADKNTFVTDKRIYDPSGAVLREPAASGISYTVPVGQCALSPRSQFICGTKFSQCTIDTDCAAGHTYVVGGKGAEVKTGQLEIYGCKDLGAAPASQGLDVLPSEPNPTYNYGKQCGVVEVRSVQCTPGSAVCGSNAFCDSKTFTCVQQSQAQCTADWQCGTQTVYDQPTKELRKPVCAIGGTCSFQKIQTVQCFYNSECPVGWYCDQIGGYVCKESVQPKQACPNECCVGDPRYFDRLPPSGQVCCASGRVAPTQNACFGEPIACKTQLFGLCMEGWTGFLIIVIILVLAIFLIKGIGGLRR